MSGTVADGTFYGAVRGMRRAADLVLAETAYGPHAEVPRHAHETPLMCLVLEGTLIESAEGITTPCDVGHVLFHPAGVVHGHRFRGARTRCFSVQLGGSWPARARALGLDPAGAPRLVRRPRATRLARALHEELRTPDDATGLAVEGLTIAILAELGRRRDGGEARVPQWALVARDYVEASFHGPVRLAEIAHAAGVHPVHLSRAFPRHFGCTLTTYVRRLRLEEARRALVATDDSVASIALGAGFADQGHFCRRFKALTGSTPSAYRARRRMLLDSAEVAS